ncbi:hypothetical protein Cni_G07791 [Canna indica]|uniref:Uncharacterized protein n=1 Tax=Canna indica TaxID=4628 RepID=A0AAQ3JZ46_9LILI|nr:hypothetical protein Cni_G07791 [Canna indica]
MEFVGRAVKKRFPRFGIFSGVVESYDPAAGYFRVMYEDGDSEDLEYREVASMLMEMNEEAPPQAVPIRRNGRGRPPKKRRRSELDLAGGEDADLGSGKVADADSVGEDASLIKENGHLKKNGGKCSVSECNGGGFAGVVKENGTPRVVGEFIGNDVLLNAEAGRNVSTDVKLEAGSEVYHIGARGLLEHAMEISCEKSEHRELEELKSEICDHDGTPLQNEGCDHPCPVESYERSTKRRRRLSGKNYSLQDMPLRRSTRRANAAMQSHLDSFDSHISKSESISQHCTMRETDSYTVPESKPELPPSSSNLDLHELPILDFFSVYSFLRSFSRVLFLSPFSLEMFLAALRCNFANSLIDHIHFSILQTLKQHLEFLSGEGSQPAIHCLRTLNWDLLDLVTWPVYLAGYLLNHNSTIKSLLKFTHSNIMSTEYYTQPASVKLEMLRCLCDGVVEAEIIRSELNIRMNGCEINVDTYNNVNRDRNYLTINDPEGSLVQEMPEDTADGNSDDCCLCRMDGSLLCCDGCPAAFHSKCVGVAKDLLPEGDWYCPECLMEKHDGLTRMPGAEVLGIDPNGRAYFSCCGYLLVSDSYDSVISSHFYNRDDIDGVIRVLKSSHSYTAIVNAISTYWKITFNCSSSTSRLCHEITERNENIYMHFKDLLSSFQNVSSEDVGKCSKDTCTNEPSGPSSASPLDLSQTKLTSLDNPSGISHVFASSGNKEQLDDNVNHSQLTQQTTADCPVATDNPVNEVIAATTVDAVVENPEIFASTDQGGATFITKRRKVVTCQLPSDPDDYINYFIFGRVASSFAEDFMHKSSEINMEPKKSEEDIVLAQRKAISKRCLKVNYHSFLNLSSDVQKEKCGWCHSCRTSNSSDCLIVANEKHLEVSKEHAVGLRSEKKKKSHINAAMHDLLLIEDRLSGLLSGPWENPHFSSTWRKAVMKASNVAVLKHMLLTLESNLRRVTMSPDWAKPVDSTRTVGSACHVFNGSIDVFSNCGGSRKQGKRTTSSSELSISQAVGALNVCWWRGGRLSRHVFHWKMLPRSLTSKGGRQAGCKKISNVSYPDGTEFARRSKSVAWQAAVEMSKTVAQLTFLIKEFDSNIRWLELLKTPPSLQLTKESKNLARLFRKVIIRRKSMEGTTVRYLLDFGKRENLPPIVARNGIIHEDPSSERKKFWLSENHIPLYLIKAFELRKLARAMKTMGSKLLSVKVDDCNASKPERLKGLAYLISRAEKLEIKLCGHCNKNVIIREAVKCHLCEGYFHRKHFKVPKGVLTADYICYQCNDKTSVKAKTERQKIVSQKKKASTDEKSTVLTKKRKRILIKSKKKPNIKRKYKKAGNKKAQSGKAQIAVCHKRKRTVMHYSFWLNGLKWTRKEDDARGRHFRKTKVVLPSQRLIRSSKKPVCCLCLKEYNSGVIYVSCENCGDWFHGDAYSLVIEEINNLIGFKCHKCRGRSIPLCPFSSLEVGEVHVTLTPTGQDVEEKLHSGTFQRSLPMVHHKNYLDLQNNGPAHVTDEAASTLQTEYQGRNIPVCLCPTLDADEIELSRELTIAVTVINLGQEIEEKLHCGTSESSSSPLVKNADYSDQRKDDSTCAIDEATFTSQTEYHGRSIPVPPSSSLVVKEIKLFKEFTTTETIINVGHDIEEKLHCGTFEDPSSAVCDEYLNQQKDDSTCARDEATYTSQTEHQQLSIPVCPSPSLHINVVEPTITETVTVGQEIKDLYSRASESSSPLVHDEDYLDHQKDGSKHARDEATLSLKAESANASCCLQSFHPMVEPVIPCQHDDDFNVVAPSQEMGKRSTEMVIVHELLTPDTLDHSKESQNSIWK